MTEGQSLEKSTPRDSVSLSGSFEGAAKKIKEDQAMLEEIEKKFPKDCAGLKNGLASSNPDVAFKKIKEKIKTLKKNGVSDKGISVLLKSYSEDIAKGIESTAENKNFRHIIKLAKLLDQYKFTQNDIEEVFSHINPTYHRISSFVECIENILEKNDINSLQEFTKFLSNGTCKLKTQLAYKFADDWSFRKCIVNAVIRDNFTNADEIISFLERIGLTKEDLSPEFSDTLSKAFRVGDKDLISQIISYKNKNKDNQSLVSHIALFNLEEIMEKINNSQGYGLTKDDIKDFLRDDVGKESLRYNLKLLCYVSLALHTFQENKEQIASLRRTMKLLEELGFSPDDRRKLFLDKEVSSSIEKSITWFITISTEPECICYLNMADDYIDILKENGLSSSYIGIILKNYVSQIQLGRTINEMSSQERDSDLNRLLNILKGIDFSDKDIEECIINAQWTANNILN